jgi:drug/metabolite transporter (DMT)-like permease
MIALMFIGSNVLWAYAQVITKKLNGVNPVQLNLHLGIIYAIGTGLLYPSMVEKQVEVSNFLVGIIACGFVTAFSQIFFIGAIKMTKNTGVVTTFSFNSVIVGYLVSVIKYNEPINPVCIIGAGLILFGLLRILLKDKTQ